ncbi:hypothetical protein [Bradyrhizobium cosmicum]|uniref:hypothetical protein n=1 Tax=Bradyrhizobium cosmicum TaxID=1404864 RepID=UPI0028EF7851|nr:hypothetical protein [Bradyrhizobium cosmicum]
MLDAMQISCALWGMIVCSARGTELCALFGWSKFETAEIYIREANKRARVDNAFARLDEHRKRKTVSLKGSKPESETKRRNTPENQSRNSRMVGPAGLEPATRPL